MDGQADPRSGSLLPTVAVIGLTGIVLPFFGQARSGLVGGSFLLAVVLARLMDVVNAVGGVGRSLLARNRKQA